MLDRIRQRIGLNSTSRAGGRPWILYILAGVGLWFGLGIAVSMFTGAVEWAGGLIAFGVVAGAIGIGFYIGRQACGWMWRLKAGTGEFNLRFWRR